MKEMAKHCAFARSEKTFNLTTQKDNGQQLTKLFFKKQKIMKKRPKYSKI